MRLSTILKIVGVLVVAVIVAAVAVILSIDPNDYKDDIQQAAKDATGRDLTIEGDIGLSLGLTTALEVNKVRFANAEWGSEPNMLRAEQVAVQVAVLPLISGQVDIKGIVIRDADILIEKAADGRSNTEFETAEKAGAEAPSGDGGGEEGGQAINIAISEVAIENATVTLRDAQANTETVLALTKFDAKGSGTTSPLDIDLVATLTMDGNQLPLELAGTVGAPATLMRGGSFPLDVKGKALGFDFTAKGQIADPQAMTGIDLALEASAKDLSGLKPFAGDGLPTASPFSFKGNVSGGGDSYKIAGLALKLGATDIGGDISASLAGPRPRIDGTISSSKIDLTELMPADDGKQPASAGGSAGSGGGGQARPGKVFPADPLPLDGLKAADAKLAIAVGQFIAPGIELADMSANITLDNGNLAVDPFGFALSGSKFDGAVSLAGRTPPAKLAFKLKAPQLDMGKMLKEQADFELLRGDAAVDVDVTGTGNSVAGIMASLNGYSRMLMEEGQAKTESFDLIVGGLTGVMNSLFASKQEWVVLNCLATDFKITKGVAESQVTLMDTELLTITGEGGVDLGKETIDFKVTPAPKSATLNVSVPVKIGGTLAEPTFRPDELATVKKLGSLLGLAVFPPAAIAGLADLGGEDNPCIQIAKKGVEKSSGGQQSAPSSVEDAVKDPGKALEGVGEGLKNLFNR